MAPTPLFTRDELSDGFALLVSPARADELATRWFELFADEVDERGRFVYGEAWGSPQPRSLSVARDPEEQSSAESIERDEALFRHFDDAVAEDWLMRLGDLHLALVALVNDDLFERMSRARDMSEAAAARNRLQLQRAVRAYRRSRGWPPAV